MILVFADEDLGEQAGRGQALVDDLRGQGLGSDGLALSTGVLGTDVAMHEELNGFAVELLADLPARGTPDS